MEKTFDPELIRAIFKLVWSRRALERERDEGSENLDGEVVHRTSSVPHDHLSKVSQVGAGTSKKNRPTTANANALKLSSELLRLFITEAVQRAATIAEAEGVCKIETNHLERILPQLLLDF